jgi:two-component system, cell cycle response regulator CtrA
MLTTTSNTCKTATSTCTPAPPTEHSCPFPAPAKPATSPPEVRSSRRILIVEDESIIRQCSSLALTGAGYLVDAVEEGQAGWEALQARSYDLLITDNQMPGLSGTDLVRRLRSARMTLPVILASGGSVPEDAASGSRLQPVSALPKPFSSVELLARVAEMLQPVGHAPDGPGVTLRLTQESYLHWGLNE